MTNSLVVYDLLAVSLAYFLALLLRFDLHFSAIPYDKNKPPSTGPEAEDENADYFFGMEMSASFIQTPNGKDAWGHDIIFEFSGDDDMWFYVDGELVLDLGGIHKALTGTINFSTGEVNSNGNKTTLRQVFADNYAARGMSQQEIDQKLNDIFGPTGTVFKSYTSHEMKMFYMERGTGSSNLHMRFNLAATKPGLVKIGNYEGWREPRP